MQYFWYIIKLYVQKSGSFLSLKDLFTHQNSVFDVLITDLDSMQLSPSYPENKDFIFKSD